MKKFYFLTVISLCFMPLLKSQCPTNSGCPTGYTYVSGALIDLRFHNSWDPALGYINVTSAGSQSGFMLNTTPPIDMTVTVSGSSTYFTGTSDLKNSVGAGGGNSGVSFKTTIGNQPIYFTNIPLRFGDIETGEGVISFSITTPAGTTNYGSGSWDCFVDKGDIEIGTGGLLFVNGSGYMTSNYASATNYQTNKTATLPIGSVPVSSYAWSSITTVVLHFAAGTAIDGACVPTALLPVKLVKFDAEAISDNVLLQWQTASEENNEGFRIERSGDGRSWQDIAFVRGNGTTSEGHKYAHTDDQPLSGTNYYRLKQVDYDGIFEYSPTVAVKTRSGNLDISLHPNPATGRAFLELGADFSGQAVIHLYSLLGERLKTQVLTLERGAHSVEIELSGLPAGVYLTEVIAGENRWQERLVVR